jgi:hypothetical protein
VFQLLKLNYQQFITEREQRITDIINRLDSLTLEVNALTQELKTLIGRDESRARAYVTTKEDKETNDHNFKEGKTVIIRNGYQGLKGTVGTVTHTTKTQVTLLDRSGKSHRRKYTNVNRIKKANKKS